MDLLLVNLVVMGFIDRDLSPLMEYVEAVSRATDVPIPDNYPVVGRDAFRTATGVHAAAVVKAWKKGDRDLMDAVYSAIPASLVGRQQEIEVGPMSGKSNVVFWLEQHGIPCSEPIVDRVFARAKIVDDGADRSGNPRRGVPLTNSHGSTESPRHRTIQWTCSMLPCFRASVACC